jgi:tetratricopeptide (TPR) repeat protein
MAKAWMDLAELAFLQGDFVEALRCARSARDLAVRSQRSEPLLGLGGTLSVARALTELGELEAAGRELEAAEPLVEKTPGAYVKSEWLRLRAQLELARGAPAAAAITARRALDTAGPLFDGRVEGALMRLVLGQALLATHRAQEALAMLTEARAASERRGALPGPVFAALAVQQSLTESAVGRPDEALASAERALAMLEGIEGNPRLRAQAQLTAASARWATGAARGKAVEEAQQALATAQAAKLAPLEQEARAWLSAHPAP